LTRIFTYDNIKLSLNWICFSYPERWRGWPNETQQPSF